MFRLAQDLAAVYGRMQPVCAEVGFRGDSPFGPAVTLEVRSRAFVPDEARRIAAALLRSADAADEAFTAQLAEAQRR